MGLFVEACAEIQRATGATIQIIHHTGKNGIGERGSSVLRCACETMIELSKDEGYITLSCDKMKDAPEFNPCTFQLLPVALGNDDSSCVIVPSEKVVQTQRDPLTKNQRQLLEALSLEVFAESGAKTTALISERRESHSLEIQNKSLDLSWPNPAGAGDARPAGVHQCHPRRALSPRSHPPT